MRTYIVSVAVLLIVSMLYPACAGALGPYLNYSGRVLDGEGEPAKDGAYLLTFALFDNKTEGTQLWGEQQYVNTEEGLYSVLMGAVQPIESLEENKALYLAIAQPGEDAAKVERARIVFLVPDGIGTEHIRDGAVTPAKLSEGMGMRFVYNDFSDSTTAVVGQEVSLKSYTMPANTLKKGMLVTVTGEAFAYGAALTLYVNGRLVKSTVYESQLDGLMRAGFGGINARLIGLAWDKPITVEVRGVITSNVGAMRVPQEVACTGLTVLGD